MRALWIGLLVAALTAQLALAGELLTYRTPDGKVGITDDPKLVPPGSEILRRDQETPRHGKSGEDAVAPPAHRNLPAQRFSDTDPDAVEAARWRQKLRQARQDEERAAHALELAQRDYRSCRRRETLGTSSQTHIPGEAACDEAPVTAAEREYERAKTYAEDGIEDECRRASCLPGWLRSP